MFYQVRKKGEIELRKNEVHCCREMEGLSRPPRSWGWGGVSKNSVCPSGSEESPSPSERDGRCWAVGKMKLRKDLMPVTLKGK